MRINKSIFLLVLVSTLIIGVSQVSGLSNESITAENNIKNAEICILTMSSLEIPTIRANESLQESLKLYDAQLLAEKQRKNYDYKLVNQYALEVCNLKEISIKAKDELNLFKESYESSANELDLSSLNVDYDKIIKSFEEERFEETLSLIDQGYISLSEAESSQTTLKLFYKTSTENIKYFFIENWRKIIIVLLAAIIVLTIFWRTLIRFRIRMKLYNLSLREKSINNLIKKMQFDYFRKKTLSETEYRVKLEKFKEMIRDIKRQIPALKEELIKIKKEEPKFKKSKIYKRK